MSIVIGCEVIINVIVIHILTLQISHNESSLKFKNHNSTCLNLSTIYDFQKNKNKIVWTFIKYFGFIEYIFESITRSCFDIYMHKKNHSFIQIKFTCNLMLS